MSTTPTVGRQVWYKPREDEKAFPHDQPFSATVCHVHSETCVNLEILMEDGSAMLRTSVILAQDRPATPGECEWMPYQIKQHAKHADEDATLAVDTSASPTA